LKAIVGGVVGSHGRSHVPFTEFSDDELRAELEQSRADLREHVAPEFRFVAYPNGRYDERVRVAVIDAGFCGAYTTDLGRNGAGTDRWSLRRVTPKAWDSRATFLFRVLTGEPPPYRWEQRRKRAWSRPKKRAWAAERISRLVVRVSPGRDYRADVMMRELERQAGEGALRVLDAGSEDGLLAIRIARRRPSWRVLAVDMNADALIAGVRRARSQGLRNVDFVQADLTHSIRDAVFDAAIAVDSLTEIPRDRDAIASIAASLRVGGVFLIHTPVADWQPVLRSSLRAWPRAVRRGYHADELAGLLEGVGLRVEAIRPTYRAVGHLGQEVRDRWIKGRRPLVQVALLPVVYVATLLERYGLTFGQARAMLVVARRR
jgi:SAM-dependent methyltransferase